MQMNAKGQVSIFFSTTVVVLITFIAFIVNIGIFVKAKINLQNATDAAAYAGASVQARQLTNIAYMNWEMRNVFKEWMFKYYVLGGLNLDNVANPQAGERMEFLMSTYGDGKTKGEAQAKAEDKYNFPSVCVDFANTGGVGMCTKYLVPGLPRFESSNVLGMDETTNAFIDTIVTEKSKDCSKRSSLNFYTANNWAYNVDVEDVSNISSLAPAVASDFMGAFPKAFEIALRIRNLEAQVNEPPLGNICSSKSTGVNCSITTAGLSSVSKERGLKAFLSGKKNIARTANKLMQNSFTLTEVSPTLNTGIQRAGSLSTLLIPSDSEALKKYYLDLKLTTVNYATFYTAFTATTGKIGIQGSGLGKIDAEGQCNATKIGLPIPGYPLGFSKNPDFLTYYAVEGKSKFLGLFSPFENAPFVITAYAVAKPFGGRIGPMHFDVSESGDLPFVKPRGKKKSSSYITALDTATFEGTFGAGTGGGTLYQPGMPVPINIGNKNNKFWLTDATDTVGGRISEGEVFYGIPNLIYEYPRGNIGNRDDYQSVGTDNIQVIARKGTAQPPPSAGLYNKRMFELFKANLSNIGGTVSTEDISNAIFAVRAPTLYEAHNYMIPTPEDLNARVKTDSWGAITGTPTRFSSGGRNFSKYQLSLYAPLFSANDPRIIFKSPEDLENALGSYLDFQEQAIMKYRNSMNLVAANIFNNNKSGTSAQNTGKQAAAALSDLTPSQYAQIGSNPGSANQPAMMPSCNSINGKFIYFYTGKDELVSTSAGCVTPLRELMRARWQQPTTGGDIYVNEYSLPDEFSEELFTAYRPGREHDAGAADGVQVNPLNGRGDKMIRNFYSTKLIPLKSVAGSRESYGSSDLMLIYSEGHPKSISSEAQRKGFKNPIDINTLTIDLKTATH